MSVIAMLDDELDENRAIAHDTIMNALMEDSAVLPEFTLHWLKDTEAHEV